MAQFNSSKGQFLFNSVVGKLCLVNLFIYRQRQLLIQSKKVKETENTVCCGKENTYEKEYAHHLREGMINKPHPVVSFPAGNICQCLRFNLFKSPSRELFPPCQQSHGHLLQAPTSPQGALKVRDKEEKKREQC